MFGLGVVLAGIAFGAGRLDPRWLLAPGLGFIALVVAHDRVLRRAETREHSVRYYEDGIARLDARFAGRGASGERFRDPEHPYADDLDLFGAGGLFELLCRARTAAGEAMLAAWLLAPAPSDEARGRQAAVRELRPAQDLRESLALVGDAVATGLHAEALERWGESAPPAPAPALRAVAAALVAALGGARRRHARRRAAPDPVARRARRWEASSRRRSAARVRRTLAETEAPARELAPARAAARRAGGPALRRAAPGRAAPGDRDRAAPRHRGRSRACERLVDLLDARRNQLFAPIGAALLFTTQVALAIDAWRARCGPSLRAWIDATAELEALASLATHAHEHPDDVFPELADGPPRFEAEALGHPLLPESRCVRNDVRLGDAPRLLLVSGSNMSGKSTLLRSVGVAAVLAQAGAPVCARRLVLSPLAVGASLRVFDSLKDGHSHFYNEIRRLRSIVELTRGSRAVLFLLDEILHGTNSHDRRIGAEAVVRSLVERGALGLVTTHDLALAQIADDLGARAANVHFEDQVVGGAMHFDYRMRPGVVTRSNALALMRAIGLEV